MDPVTNFLLGKALSVGYERVVQPFIAETNVGLERIGGLLEQESERERLAIFRRALGHRELIGENARHLEQTQDLLIQACASDIYASVPRLLHGLMLAQQKSTASLGEGYILEALKLNPVLLETMARCLPQLCADTEQFRNQWALGNGSVTSEATWTVFLMTSLSRRRRCRRS